MRDANGDLELIEKGLASRWRDRPLTEIDDDAVFRVVEEVRHKGVPGLQRKNAEASEPRARIMHAVLSKMFNWLVEKRRLKANPMANLKRPAPSSSRDRVLTNQEIVAFWRGCDHVPKPFAATFKLLLLTGSRLNEVARMEVRELSGDGATWTIPSRRTKNKRAHTVPLAPLTRAIIAGVERLPECPYVFSTNQRTPISGFSKIKRRLDAKMKDAARLRMATMPPFIGRPPIAAPWRLHDLRRTVATGMADIGIQPHIIEAVLNHVSGARAGVAGIYNRAIYATEKAEALERWASHVVGMVGDRRAEGEDVSSQNAE
jgi:integrase